MTVDRNRDILGLRAGDGGEGAKYWLQVLTEIKYRGVEDVLMLVCDGLKGMPDSVDAVWPATIVQTCVVHLMRASFRYAARGGLGRDLAGPRARLPGRHRRRGRGPLPFSSRRSGGGSTRRSSGCGPTPGLQFVPFLQFDREIRRVVCTTNAIESVNARIRKAVRARDHFPNEQAALKCVYLAVMALDPTGKDRARWTQRWKAALNAFEITFDGRLSAGRR